MGDAASRAVIPPTSSAMPRVYAALAGQTLISAFTYLAAKRAMEELSPGNLVMVRLLLSAVVFALILVLSPGPILPPRRAWGTLFALGLLCGPLNQGLFLFGLSRSNAAHAALLYALTPVGVYLVSMFTGRERAGAHRLFGIGVAFAGVVVLLTGRGLAEAYGPLLGDSFILGAVMAWVLYTTEGKRVAQEHGAIRTTAWSMIAAAVWCLPGTPAFLRLDELGKASPVAIGCVAFLVVLTSVVSYLLWYYALSRVEASRVAVFANLQPVATAIAAWAILGERLVWEIYVGGFLVLLGVRMTQRVALSGGPWEKSASVRSAERGA